MIFLHRFAFHKESFLNKYPKEKKGVLHRLAEISFSNESYWEKHLEPEYLKDRLKSYLNLKRAVASDI